MIGTNTYRTQHFSPEGDEKFTCSCCKGGGISIATLIVLEVIRMHFNKPVTILSAARCRKYNKQVGGSKNSEHIFTEDEPLVDAVDIHVKDVSVQELYMFLKNLPFANLLGIGKYKNFIHIDTRGYAARWSG